MDTRRMELLIQAVATASIVLGIGLVVWELRQQREFAEAQNVDQDWAAYSAGVQSG